MTALVEETDTNVDSLLTELFAHSQEYTFVMSVPDLAIVHVNPAFANATQRSAASWLGSQLDQLSSTFPQELRTYLTTCAKGNQAAPVNSSITSDAGVPVPVLVRATLLDSPRRLVCNCTDLRPQTHIEKQLARSEDRFREIFDSAPIGIMLLDTSLCIFQANQYAAKLLEYYVDDLSGKAFSDFLSNDDQISLEQDRQQLEDSKTKISTREPKLLSRSGARVAVVTNLLLHRSEDKKPLYYLMQIADISDRKYYEAKLEQLAYYDSLTDLANRRQLMDRIALAVERAKRQESTSALLYIDLDLFKRINDTFGHATGDMLLKSLADRLTQQTRATDLVARPGGDEFAILIEDVRQPHDVEHLANKILNAISVPLAVQRKNVSISASIGITLIPQDGKTVDLVMKNADLAMYHAKSEGRNKYRFFGKQLNTEAALRIQLEQELSVSLENGDFEIYLQPKVDVSTGTMIGAEALCRWNHPKLGLVGPNDFIHIAEESGLIIELGAWVVTEACKAIVELSARAERSICVSANVSAVQLRDQDFAPMIESLIRTYEIQPHQLELELTESILIEDIENSLRVLNSLKDLGITLSIDDFGTGYSSFEYLKRLPMSILKIDRTFIKDIPESGDDRAITSGLIAMAHRMQMSVVAEGVETPEQLIFLRDHGCDIAQGFYLGKPVPIDELEIKN